MRVTCSNVTKLQGVGLLLCVGSLLSGHWWWEAQNDWYDDLFQQTVQPRSSACRAVWHSTEQTRSYDG